MEITARIIEEEEEDQTHKKTKMGQQQNQQQEVDRISQLPDDILHPVLGLLTLKEACITSALSKRWRNLFPTLPGLRFDGLSFLYSTDGAFSFWELLINMDRWRESVRHILQSRAAPVRSCTIRSDYLDVNSFGNIVRLLCNDGIRELTFSCMCARSYTVPSCLYRCQTLTRLELCNCELNVPSKFSGLGRLNAPKIESCEVKDGDLQRLILGCGALESLTVERCSRLRDLAFNSNNVCVRSSSSIVSYHLEKSKLEDFRRGSLLSQPAAPNAFVGLKTAASRREFDLL